jgi:hypothetical protein
MVSRRKLLATCVRPIRQERTCSIQLEQERLSSGCRTSPRPSTKFAITSLQRPSAFSNLDRDCCSNPDCRRPTTGRALEDDSTLDTRNPAHITAALNGHRVYDGTLSVDRARGLLQHAARKGNRYTERVIAWACKKAGIPLTELRSGSRRWKLPRSE